MTKIERVLKDINKISLMIMSTSCPSDWGLKDSKSDCGSIEDCEKCWNEEVLQ